MRNRVLYIYIYIDIEGYYIYDRLLKFPNYDTVYNLAIDPSEQDYYKLE